jgi:hypothetical protein
LSVLVLDQRKRPVMPCGEKRARLLLEHGRVVVHRHDPFTTRLGDRVGPPLNDAAAIAATGCASSEALAGTGLPVEAWSGGGTKFNRARLGIPKTDALDAACVGEIGARLGWQQPTLAIKASARAHCCQTKLTAHCIPPGYCMRSRSVRGFQTGDMVRAEAPTGSKAGTHVGRAAVGGSGSLRVGNADAINARYCKLLHRADGYCYARQPALPPRPEERGLKRGRL